MEPEIVDGIRVESPEEHLVAPYASLVASVIRANCPGIELLRIETCEEAWERDGESTVYYRMSISMTLAGRPLFYAHQWPLPTPATMSQLYTLLYTVFSDATAPKCKCDSVTLAWPDYTTLEGRIRAAVEACS